MARNNVNMGVKSWGEVKVEGTNVDLDVGPRQWEPLTKGTFWESVRRLWGDGYANKVRVRALGDLDVKLDIGGSADLMSTGKITGSIFAGAFGDVSDTSGWLPANPPEGSSPPLLSGRGSKIVDAQESSWVAMAARGSVDIKVIANSAIAVESWGAVNGSYRAGSALDVMGNAGVKGSLTADGYLTAKSFGTYEATTVSEKGFVSVFSKGDFNGKVTAYGDAQVESWADVKGEIKAGSGGEDASSPTAAVTAHGNVTSGAKINSSHNVAITAYGNISTSQIKGDKGNVELEAFGTFEGAKAIAGVDINVASWGTITSLTAEANNGNVSVWSKGNVNQLTIEAAKNIDIGTAEQLKVTATSKTGNIDVSSLGDIQSGTELTTEAGSINVFGGKTIKATATAANKAADGPTQAIDVLAFGKIEGTYTARNGISITGLQDVDVTATSNMDSIDVFGSSKVKGTYTAAQNIEVSTVGSAGSTTTTLDGTYTATKGNITALSLGKIDATIDAAGAATVFSASEIAGTITAGGAATVTAQKEIMAEVTGGDEVRVWALGGDLIGNVTSKHKSVSAISSRDVTGDITAETDATVFSKQNTIGDVKATKGNAQVIALGDVSGDVTAGLNVDIFAVDSVSSSKIDAGQNVDIVSHGDVQGTITAGAGASILTKTIMSAEVTAQQGVSVTALEEIEGNVTAVTGSADLVAGKTITGQTKVGMNASLLALGTISGKVEAGQAASITSLGDISSKIEAGQDASVWSKGAFDGEVIAQRNVSVMAIGEISGDIEAVTGSAYVTGYATLSSKVTAGANATVWMLGNITGDVTATSGNADVFTAGSLTNTIKAGQNAAVRSFDDVEATINAGGGIDVTVFRGSTELTATAGASVSLQSSGEVTAELAAGSSVNVIALDSVEAEITSGTSANVTAQGSFQGEITTQTGDLSVFVTESVQGEFLSGASVSLGALSTLNGVEVTAIGDADLYTLNLITGAEVHAQDIFAWGQMGITGSQFTSTGSTMVLSNTNVHDVEIDAGSDATAASLGSPLVAEVTAGNNVFLFGLGVISGELIAGGSAQVVAYGTAQIGSIAVGGELSAFATETLALAGTAGHIRLVAYSLINSALTAIGTADRPLGQLSAWSRGPINGSLVAVEVDTIQTWEDLLGNVASYGSIARLYVWGSVHGDVVAGTTINEIYLGGDVGPHGSITAPTIGVFEIHNRTPFVDLPAMPTTEVQQLIATTAEAARTLLDWADNLHQTQVELGEAVESAEAMVAMNVAAAQQALSEMETESHAQFSHVAKQLEAELTAARARIDWALEQGSVSATGAQNEILQTAAYANDAASRALSELQAEADTRLKIAVDDKNFAVSQRTLIEQLQTQRKTVADQQFAALVEVKSAMFVGDFLLKLVEYSLDVVQEILAAVGTIGDFIPVVGPAIGATADTMNAAISAMRGRYVEAAASLVAATPFVGNIAKYGVKAGGKAAASEGAELVGQKVMKHLSDWGDDVARAARQGLSKFVRQIPELVRDAARRVKCVVTGTGCFVAGTLVVTGELPAEATTVADTGLPFRDSLQELGNTFLCLAVVSAAILESHRRRKEQLEREERERLERERILSLEDDYMQDDFEFPEDVYSDMLAERACAMPSALRSEEGIREHEQAGFERGLPNHSDWDPAHSSANDVAFSSFAPQKELTESGSVALLESAGAEVAVQTVRGRTAPTQTSRAANQSKPKANSLGSRLRMFAAKPLAWLTLFTLIGLAGLLGNALLTSAASEEHSSFASTNNPFTNKPIEQIQVGEWVLAENPESDPEPELRGSDLENLQRLTFRLIKTDGSALDIILLRDRNWIELRNACVGNSVEVELEELGASGPAEVIAIEPRPSIAPRPSSRHHLVTGTFTHTSSSILEVFVEGVAEPIICTSNHLFWSNDRLAFAEAGDLQLGEKLRSGGNSNLRIRDLRSRGGTSRVYNLEVNSQHVYYVSSAGILVHNSYVPPNKPAFDKAFYDNQYRQLSKNSDLIEADNFLRADGVLLTAHPNKHSLAKADQLDVLNNWQRSWTGTNKNGRPVDIYWKDGMAVVTQGGAKNKVITAYDNVSHTRWSDRNNWQADITEEIYHSFARNLQR